jgi:hypothetical protein
MTYRVHFEIFFDAIGFNRAGSITASRRLAAAGVLRFRGLPKPGTRGRAIDGLIKESDGKKVPYTERLSFLRLES